MSGSNGGMTKETVTVNLLESACGYREPLLDTE